VESSIPLLEVQVEKMVLLELSLRQQQAQELELVELVELVL
jgi:hypothetical protein